MFPHMYLHSTCKLIKYNTNLELNTTYNKSTACYFSSLYHKHIDTIHTHTELYNEFLIATVVFTKFLSWVTSFSTLCQFTGCFTF